MSREDHPSFRYKDYSNNQPTLFDLIREAEQLMADTLRAREQTAIDLKFIELMLREGFQ